MDRLKQLQQLCENLDAAARTTTAPLLGEIVFLEKRLDEMRSYPFISVNPNNPAQQKQTPAAKMYKELLQQYNGCIKILLGVLTKNDGTDTSPLREYLERLKND